MIFFQIDENRILHYRDHTTYVLFLHFQDSKSTQIRMHGEKYTKSISLDGLEFKK